MTEQEEFEFRLRLEREQSAMRGSDPAAFPKALGRAVLNTAAGAIRGAGSIGATILAPIDIAGDALAGKGLTLESNRQRRRDMDSALSSMGADTDSLAYGAGKLTGEIAGTAGAGGAVANVLSRAPGVAAAAPNALQAIRTSGMSAGSATGPANMLLRIAGGGVSGAAGAGMVNPSDAGFGAAIGAVLPPAIQGVGLAGAKVAGAFKSPQNRAVERLAAALEADPATVAAQLQGAVTMVPGSKPTAAQVLRTPQASILERVVSESAGGASLKNRYAEQNAARLGALDGVAPVDPRGLRSIQDDFGANALAAIRGGDSAAKARTSAAYQAVPQDEAALYVPQLGGLRDEFFPAGSFGGRAAVDDAVRAAERIGTMTVPGIMPLKGGRVQGATLSQAVRGLGGISIKENSGLRGEVAALRGDLKNLVRQNGGRSPAEVAEAMYEAGYLADESTDALFDALRAESRGQFSYGANAGIDDYARAQAERAMGDAPAGELVPKKATLREVDALRKSIGNAQRAAARDPERATEAAALARMKAAIDDRINEVVRGDGAIDETLPIDWANALTEAQGLKRAQVEKYRTGPQAAAFDRGADGLPKVQGGEFASKVWGNRAGIAADITQFRKVLDDKPELLGQFRSMVTTEGAGTATDGGKLTGKFVRWVENSLPGLRASFEPGQVRMLERIAADIKRANVATAAGAAQGSNTYQNASNALSLGLLDSPLLNAAANRVPVVNALAAPSLQWMRETARERMANELAALLADPAGAGNALAALSRRQSPNPLIGLSVARSAPALVADR